MMKRANGAAGGREALNLGDRADSRFDKVCDYHMEDTGSLGVHNWEEEEAAPNAEDHSMLAMAAEKVLHLVYIDDLPCRRGDLVVQTKKTLFVAYPVEVGGLLVSRKNAQEAVRVFDEGGSSAKGQYSLAGKAVGDEHQTAESLYDSLAE